METQVKDQEEEPAKIPEPAIPTEVTQHQEENPKKDEITEIITDKSSGIIATSEEKIEAAPSQAVNNLVEQKPNETLEPEKVAESEEEEDGKEGEEEVEYEEVEEEGEEGEEEVEYEEVEEEEQEHPHEVSTKTEPKLIENQVLKPTEIPAQVKIQQGDNQQNQEESGDEEIEYEEEVEEVEEEEQSQDSVK